MNTSARVVNYCSVEYCPKKGDLVLYNPNPEKKKKHRPCFAVVVSFDFFKKHAGEKKLSDYVKTSGTRVKMVFLLKINSRVNVEGDMVYHVGYATNLWRDVKFVRSLFNEEEMKAYLYDLRCLETVFEESPNSGISAIHDIFVYLDRMLEDIKKDKQGDAFTLYGDFIKHMKDGQEEISGLSPLEALNKEIKNNQLGCV